MADFAAALPRTGAVAGLDLGTKTIGVAVSDGLRQVASPLMVIRREKLTLDAAALLRIVAADMHHFERVLEQIGAQPFVARTKSVLVLSALLRRPVTPRHDEP